MKIATPKIDKRTFKDLLKQSQALAPFYTPTWVPGQQGEPGQALLYIYLHLQEQILSRLNRVPDKNFVAFLDMMGMRLLPAQSAQAAVTFTLANGTIEPVLAPRGTLLSGQATDGSGEVIYQTQKDLLITPAILQGIFSYDAAEDSIYEHPQDDKAPKPFTVFAGLNNQEHSFYLGHADLLNQKKPTKIELDFLLSENASDGSDLFMVWEYFDGTRWAEIKRFERDAQTHEFDKDDDTRLFTKSGTMTLEKKYTGEIAEKEIGGIKNRWIRCRLTKKLLGGKPVRLPVINAIEMRVNPIAAFAPDLTFNNDIPLNLEAISLQMQAMDSAFSFAESLPPPPNPPAPVDRKIIKVTYSDKALTKGDFLKLHNRVDDSEVREVVSIDPVDLTQILLNAPLRFDYEKSSIVALFTALRPEGVEVRVGSTEGSDVSVPSKVALFHRGKKELANLTKVTKITVDKPNDRTILGLAREGPASSKPFYIETDLVKITPKINPFGKLPLIFDTFYIASNEAFSKKGAEITLAIEAALNDPPPQNAIDPVLSWEYWNGKSWRGIRVSDTTKNFSGNGQVIFTCPDDIEKVEVNGEAKFWIRARIIDGDYGKEILVKPAGNGPAVDIIAGKVHFPIINDLRIDYKNASEQPQKCLTFSNLNLEDHTADSIDVNKTFSPFTTMPEQFSGLFLGFDKALVGGSLSILFDVIEQFLDQDETLKMLWFYWNGSAWEQFNVEDETENLTRIGLLKFAIARDFAGKKLFGKELFWLKGSVVEGQHPKPLQIKSLHPNSTYALQADVANNEIAGSSNGTANQEFTLQHPLVISQQVYIRELILPTEEEQETIGKEEGEDAIQEKKNELGETIEILVRWHETVDFDDSDSKSRHYTMDHRLGIIKFGDGTQGMVPPVGANSIIVSYTFGGGKKGNVPVGAITSLKSAVPFVNAVKNHLVGDGGSETETLDNVLTRAPLLLKNRDRAVTPEDFEALARSASRKVVRAKCLPNADEDRNTVPGWVTVLIVPDSNDAKPSLSQQLIKIVKEGLENHSATVVSGPRHIHVTEPLYTEVIVQAFIVPVSLDKAAAVAIAAKEKLHRYIHPLTGGPQGSGWEFGEGICLSDIFALLEGIEDADHVEKIVFRVNNQTYEGNVELDKYSLPFSGEHEINIVLDSLRSDLDPCKSSKTECTPKQEFQSCEEKKNK